MDPNFHKAQPHLVGPTSSHVSTYAKGQHPCFPTWDLQQLTVSRLHNIIIQRQQWAPIPMTIMATYNGPYYYSWTHFLANPGSMKAILTTSTEIKGRLFFLCFLWQKDKE